VSASRKPRPAPADATKKASGTKQSGVEAAAQRGTAQKAAASQAARKPAAKAVRKGSQPAAGAGRPATRPGRRPPRTRPSDEAGAPSVVIGEISLLTRLGGGLAVAAALVRLVAPGFPLAHASGRSLSGSNALDWIMLLPLVGAVGAAGVLCVLGRLPRLGLAVLLPVGTAAVGDLLRTAYLLDAAGRSSQDLPLGIGSSFRYQIGAGLTLRAVADGLLVAALVAAAAGWARTVMEDDGSVDGWRPWFACSGLVVGVLAAITVGMSQLDTSVPGATAPPLLEQSGLAEVGGLVFTAAVSVWAALAAKLRPRLAMVGAFAGVAAVLATDGLTAALLAVRSPVLGVGAGCITELLAAALAGLLAVAAGRAPPRRAAGE
jgi:hypothetical protein